MNLLKIASSISFLLALSLPALPARADLKYDVNLAEDNRYKVEIAGDRDQIEKILGVNFFYNQPDGTFKDRADYIKSTLADKMVSAKRYGGDVSIYGDTAVSQGFVDVVVDIDGKNTPFKLRYLNVWLLEDGEWRLVGRQSTPVE
jgi:hypothetical protein